MWLLPALPGSGPAVATRTGADGAYEVSVPPNRYTVVTLHPDYVLDARPILVAGKIPPENFVLLPGAVIEGTVIDSESGDPVAGAKVHVGGISLRDHRSTTSKWLFASLFGAMFPTASDSDGSFRISGLPPGPVEVVASTERRTARDPVTTELAIAETRSGVTVPVAEAFTVSGFVVRSDAPRDGIPGVNVLIQASGALAPPRVSATDGAGYFELSGVIPGEYRVFAAGGAASPTIVEETISVSDSDVGDVVVRAEPAFSIGGRVEPPARANLTLEPASDVRGLAGALAAVTSSMARAEVDDSGDFRFPAVGPGDYVIVARTVEGEGRTPVRVSRSDQSDLLVEIEPSPAIEGTVTDAGGSPLSGAIVSAKPSRAQIPRAFTDPLPSVARTDERGGFEIPGLRPDSYELRVFDDVGQRPWADEIDDRFRPRTVEVAGDGSLELELEVASGGRTVRGTAVDPEGTPVADAWVRVSSASSREAPAGHQSLPALTDGSGRFEIRGLFGEDLEVEATGAKGKLRADRVKVVDGEPVTLTLAPVSTVRAAVSRDGEPVEDFELDVRGGPSSVIGRFVERENGGFQLPSLISGEYEIEIRSRDGYAKEVISVGPDPTTSVELELRPMASVRGRVIDDDGSPLEGAVLSITGVTLRMDRGEKMFGESRPRTGPDGSFEARELTAGDGRIVILRSEHDFDPIAVIEVELNPGQELDLGTIERGTRRLFFRDRSRDLGLRFYAGPRPPTTAELERIERAEDPRALLSEEGAQLWIAEVVEGGPAHRAGLRARDRIVSVGQMKIGEGVPAAEAMISLSQRWRSKGRALDWVIERDGAELRVPILVPE